MNSRGHFGIAIGVMSILMLPFGFGKDYLILFVILLSSGASALPDIDWRIGIPHRTITHTLLFAILIGVVFAFVFWYVGGIWYSLVGFFGGLMGIMLHLLGDAMNYMELRPFYPINNTKVAWRLFPADSRLHNESFLYLGVGFFFFYVLISSGILASILTQ